VREAVEVLAIHSDPREQVPRSSFGLCARHAAQAERAAEDLADSLARVERRLRILEDHLHLAADRPQLLLRRRRDVGAAEADRAGVACVRRTSALISVVLPQPDSPTIPSVSPSCSNERHIIDRRARVPIVRSIRRPCLIGKEPRAGARPRAAPSRWSPPRTRALSAPHLRRSRDHRLGACEADLVADSAACASAQPLASSGRDVPAHRAHGRSARERPCTSRRHAGSAGGSDIPAAFASSDGGIPGSPGASWMCRGRRG